MFSLCFSDKTEGVILTDAPSVCVWIDIELFFLLVRGVGIRFIQVFPPISNTDDFLGIEFDTAKF